MWAHDAIEVAKTVLEVAWTAVECTHHLHGHSHSRSRSRSHSHSHHDSDQKGTEFTVPDGADLLSAEILMNVDQEDPSWWVWVTDEMTPSNAEEQSGIDNENYVAITEEHVVDGVANFMARCIISNPKCRYILLGIVLVVAFISDTW
ncbi:hypothetical protein SAY86_012045 [Trapa natans]|uniref:Uncharacterized protein n=1 Tax=Trapa natans TaxID=22666 RepID=A0AAN7LW49_TRANT|nr:hypothetical protein SAY86_012045 [Trapa natans]